jgi:hypothetical protein
MSDDWDDSWKAMERNLMRVVWLVISIIGAFLIVIGGGILILVLALSFGVNRASPHDWYPDDCCHAADEHGDHGECHPIASCDEITPTKNGLQWHNHEFTGGQIRKSQDNRCHICATPMLDAATNKSVPDANPHCVFVYAKPDS